MKTFIIEKEERTTSRWKVVCDSMADALYAVEKETDEAEFIEQTTPRANLEIIREIND